MKRMLAFLTALIIAATSLSVVFGKEINKMSTDVRYTLETEYGDRSLLEGISFKTYASNERYLIWENTFDPFGETESVLTFKKTRLKFEPHKIGTSLQFLSYGYDFFINANQKIKNTIIKAAKDVNEGESKTINIKFSDFYTYYPLYFSLGLSDTSTIQKAFSSHYVSPDFSYDDMENLDNALNDFLKIPVKENDIWNVKISKTNGEYAYYFTNDKSFDFSCMDVVFDNKIYFTFSNSTLINNDNPGEKVDTSLIPGGYGIYLLPFSEGKVHYDKLENVFPINENSTVLYLYKDEYNSYLYLMLSENGKFTLKIIDEKSMQEIYSEELFDYSHKDWVHTVIKDDFAVFFKNEYEIKVIAKNQNGGFSQVIHYKIPEDNEFYTQNHPYSSEFEFDNGRLIMCSPDTYINNLSVERYLNLHAFIFTENGLSYYGKWNCSLGEYSIREYPFCTYMDERKAVPVVNK